MKKYSNDCLPEISHRIPMLVLSVFFLLGHLLGVLFSGMAGQSLFSLMHAVVSSRVSIVGLFSSVFLPFLFSACAVYLGRVAALFPIAFWKAFLFSYVGYGLYAAWGSAGWLITVLVMFGSLCSMPLLYWYWLRCIGACRFEIGVFSLILGILLVILAIDYYLIAPFLVGIVTF